MHNIFSVYELRILFHSSDIILLKTISLIDFHFFHVNAEHSVNHKNGVFITHHIRFLIYESNEARKNLRDFFLTIKHFF